MTEKPTYNADEAAKFLGIKRSELIRLCRKKLIRHIHMNRNHVDVRFARSELERFREGEGLGWHWNA